MTSIERKIIRIIHRLTTDYNDRIIFAPDTRDLRLNHVSVPVKLPSAEIEHAILGIADKGYIRIERNKQFIMFSILPRINHRLDYWRDEFTKRFMGGFITGLISGILLALITGIVIPYIRMLIGL